MFTVVALSAIASVAAFSGMPLHLRRVSGMKLSAAPLRFNEGSARDFLLQQQVPPGLRDAFINSMADLPLRFFIIDDSGSMSLNDGNRFIDSGANSKMVQCTRWAELTSAMKFHVNLARQACAPSEFRLLNGASPIKIGYDYTKEGEAFSTLNRLLDGSPNGGTPLCKHITEVVQVLRKVEPVLRSKGQKATLVIATDGEATDGNIAEAMRPLKDLPVWVVLRLCTDEENVVKYWADIDHELELNMDVLDDFVGEAKEVHRLNPWLTYGMPFHRLREFGVTVREMDLLDERKMTDDEIHKLVCCIYGGSISDYPHPSVDMQGLKAAVARKSEDSPLVWDPLTRKLQHWLNL
ncbi:hypothetical protein B484DRAFT_452163 [Ochromonadaceae sp. CCMP2298]|nr:hypothetical protein B484DRAFT_452163 [Ochromonadaceae sp. CCMP2298]